MPNPKKTPYYTDKLDPTEQVEAEEEIAAHLFDQIEELDEEFAGDLSRQILMMVMKRFRPDVVRELVEP